MPIQLIAAPHTPFMKNGHLNLPMVERQAEHLRRNQLSGAFVAGSTGEGQSLTVDERLELATAWCEHGHQEQLRIIIHVGHNCQRDAIRMASHAADRGADAIAVLAPSYHKPQSITDLVTYCQSIAESAGGLPFYYYDIPALTGVKLSVAEFLQHATEVIPNLAGIKFTNPDLMEFQRAIQYAGEPIEILFGCDEILLAAYQFGARGAVGSSYNFAAPLYHRMVAAIDAGEMERARQLQFEAVEMIRTLAGFGYPAAAKSMMAMLGVDCGPVRPPIANLSPASQQTCWEAIKRFNLPGFE